ncbi:MFS transporter [Neoactinobaculum massilliense]|uniref:MFS transporter n=1 Tax=Neoactinobaculum massilliense TaxID=2364794 RepID=UPI000F53C50B|nr:MFS transporter [Neoactinobaculum massilliense]
MAGEDSLTVERTASGILIRRPRSGKMSAPLVATALILVIASFQLNSTMLSPAIGDMAARLHTSTGVIGWSSNIFLAVAAAVAILVPPVADKVGRKKATIVSVIVMIIGTVLALAATTPMLLIVGRALQGACGATFALGNLTLRAILPGKKYGFYLGLVAAVNSGVAGIDTLLGGLITDHCGYRGILWVILILEVLAIGAIWIWDPETIVVDAQKMDWAGALTMTGSLWSVNMVLTLGFGMAGWVSPWTIGFLVAAVVLGITFALVERHTAAPLVPLDVLARRGTWGLLATTFFTMASAFAVLLFALPALSQDGADGFGMSATVSALMYLMPFSLVGWLLGPLVGKLAPQIGYRQFLRGGLAGSLVLMIGCVLGYQDRWVLFALAILMGATYSAACSTTLNGLGVLYSSADRPGVLPGLNSAAFNMGAAVGTGVMSSVVVRGMAAGKGIASYRGALIVGVIMGCVALVFSLALPGSDNGEEKI